ncbi:hypothetical protein BDFB_005506 [Asbolus verrucosus]|uniref:Exo endo phos domain containing protein n=1 Tax=Asbolus verrucosus TaxID=1661398 RepID=A0A482VZ57_ASBVE|nr:hypothetical protein BDFB_005506 [Asbolus verrucosus]
MVKGKICKDHKIFEKIINSIDLFHNFQFESACGLPKYTNYTHDFKDCLDYIFVEKNKMKVTNIIPFPKEEELVLYEGLPNNVFPSDHLALIVDLEFM